MRNFSKLKNILPSLGTIDFESKMQKFYFLVCVVILIMLKKSTIFLF